MICYKSLYISILLTFLLFYNISYATDSNTLLKVDPKIKIGKLENGLTYYICKNNKPDKTIFIYFIVKVGSINEDNDQLGFAHFIEHLAFKSTSHFKNAELINTLEMMGLNFGDEMNAHTGFNETVYNLQIPADKPDLIEKAFLIIEDWAHNLSFIKKEIEVEKKIISEERRIYDNAEDNEVSNDMKPLLKHSLYAERSPIGSRNIIKNANPDDLKKFYSDWYRPELMALFVVGDIEQNSAEKKIISHFANIKNPEKKIKKIETLIADNTEPIISIESNYGAHLSTVDIFFKHNSSDVLTFDDFKQNIFNEMYINMLNRRYLEITQRNDAPFNSALASLDKFYSNTKKAFKLSAKVSGNNLDNCYKTLILENHRIKLYGFTVKEFERQKKNLLKYYQYLAKEEYNTESEDLINSLINNFLTGSAIIDPSVKLKYIKEILDLAKVENINNCFNKLVTKENICFVIQAQERKDIYIPTVVLVKDFILYYYIKTLEPYRDISSSEIKITDKRMGARYISKDYNAKFDYTELTYANGAKVILKPTNLKNDQILFSASRKGGTNLYDNNTYLAAALAPQFIELNGVSNLSRKELDNSLYGKLVSITPFISENLEGFNGMTSNDDIEVFLKLLYLYFTEPNEDSLTFSDVKKNTLKQIKQYDNNPLINYTDSLNKIISKNNNRKISFKNFNKISNISFNQILNIYKDCFSDANNYYFYFVGNFNVDDIIPLIGIYIGALPAKEKTSQIFSNDPNFISGINKTDIFGGPSKLSAVTICMKNNLEWNNKILNQFYTLVDILNINLRETLRESMGEIYTIDVEGNTKFYPTPGYLVKISWACSPLNAKSLVKEILNSIKNLHSVGPNLSTLNKVKAHLIIDREKKIQKNEFWLSKLADIHFQNIDLLNFNEYKKMIESITIDDIKNISIKCLDLKNYLCITLKPNSMR